MKDKIEMRIKRKIGTLVVLGLVLAISIASVVSAVATLGEGDTKVEVVDSGDGYIYWQEDSNEVMRPPRRRQLRYRSNRPQGNTRNRWKSRI